MWWLLVTLMSYLLTGTPLDGLVQEVEHRSPRTPVGWTIGALADWKEVCLAAFVSRCEQ